MGYRLRDGIGIAPELGTFRASLHGSLLTITGAIADPDADASSIAVEILDATGVLEELPAESVAGEGDRVTGFTLEVSDLGQFPGAVAASLRAVDRAGRAGEQFASSILRESPAHRSSRASPTTDASSRSRGRTCWGPSGSRSTGSTCRSCDDRGERQEGRGGDPKRAPARQGAEPGTRRPRGPGVERSHPHVLTVVRPNPGAGLSAAPRELPARHLDVLAAHVREDGATRERERGCARRTGPAERVEHDTARGRRDRDESLHEGQRELARVSAIAVARVPQARDVAPHVGERRVRRGEAGRSARDAPAEVSRTRDEGGRERPRRPPFREEDERVVSRQQPDSLRLRERVPRDPPVETEGAVAQH